MKWEKRMKRISVFNVEEFVELNGVRVCHLLIPHTPHPILHTPYPVPHTHTHMGLCIWVWLGVGGVCGCVCDCVS